MEEHVDGMEPARSSWPFDVFQGGVELQRQPGQWVPVGLIISCPRPLHVIRGKAGADVAVSLHVDRVVDGDERRPKAGMKAATVPAASNKAIPRSCAVGRIVIRVPGTIETVV